MARELDGAVYDTITTLCESGDELAEEESYREAIEMYDEAWRLLPEPKIDWEAATWILSAIGDAHFFQRDFEEAREAFMGAVRAPEGLGNPFIHLRLGQCAFELGMMSHAEDELARAYICEGGKEIFANEDPKYFRHLQTVLEPPVGQSSL
jgi:tetratricopeptide (TPR) repeat protein